MNLYIANKELKKLQNKIFAINKKLMQGQYKTPVSYNNAFKLVNSLKLKHYDLKEQIRQFEYQAQ